MHTSKMMRSFRCLVVTSLLLGTAPLAVQESDSTESHRWHMPQRGARKLGQEVAGPPHAEWNRFGHVVNDGKDKFGDWGLRFDVDLDCFDQYASRVVAGQQNFATFSLRVMGDWRSFDVGKTKLPSGARMISSKTSGIIR
jgi:hypothetical protein